MESSSVSEVHPEFYKIVGVIVGVQVIALLVFWLDTVRDFVVWLVLAVLERREVERPSWQARSGVRPRQLAAHSRKGLLGNAIQSVLDSAGLAWRRIRRAARYAKGTGLQIGLLPIRVLHYFVEFLVPVRLHFIWWRSRRLLRRGRHSEAFAAGYGALDLARRVMGMNASSVARCLSHLAWLHAYAGHQLHSHELFLQLPPQIEPRARWLPWRVRKELTQCRRCVQANHFHGAFQKGQAALTLARQSNDSHHIAFCQSYLAWVLVAAGCLPDAHHYQSDAWQSCGGVGSGKVVCLTASPAVYQQNAFKIEIVFRLALLEFLLHRLPEAQEHVEDALRLPCDRHAYVFQRCELLRLEARILRRMNQPDRASRGMRQFESLLQQVPRIAPTLQLSVGRDHAEEAAQGGDFDKAVTAYRTLHQRLAEVLGTGHPATVVTLNHLAFAQLQGGDFARAKQTYAEFLKAAKTALPAYHPSLAEARLALAILDSFQHDAALTLQRLHEAITELNYQRFRLAARFSEDEWLHTIDSLSTNTDHVLSLVVSRLAHIPKACAEAARSVFLCKGLAAEITAIRRSVIRKKKNGHLRKMLDELAQLRRQITRHKIEGPTRGESETAHRTQLEAWRINLTLLERSLARQLSAPGGSALASVDRLADFARQLPEGTALIVFVRYRHYKVLPPVLQDAESSERYLAFVLSGNNPEAVQMVDLDSVRFIDDLVANFRKLVDLEPSPFDTRPMVPVPEEASRQSARLCQALGVTLRQKLFDPLRPALGGATRLLLCLDGELAKLPFEALPAESPGSFLLDSHQISYLASVRDLHRMGHRRRTRSKAPVVAADPDFDLATVGESWDAVPGRSAQLPVSGCSRDMARCGQVERLPATSQEGERVAQLLRVTPWLSDTVVKHRLLQMRSPVILHLATHGFFLPDQPSTPGKQTDPMARLIEEASRENPLLRSGLLLAAYNTWCRGLPTPIEAETGILTGEEVLTMELDGTELVVLSACETGLGEVHAGEGVFGLQRAFMLAGARTLVMSLWKVPDLATAILMERFYHNLLCSRLPRAEALSEAQKFLRDYSVEQLRADGWLADAWLEWLAVRWPPLAEQAQAWLQGPGSVRPFAEPYYWGAFICQGDPSPLPKSALSRTQSTTEQNGA